MSKDDDDSLSIQFGSNSFLGCLGFILSIFLLWALLFGVTINDKYYGLSCSLDKGVEVHNGRARETPDASRP